MQTVVLWRKFIGTSYLSGERAEFEPFMPGGSGTALLYRLRKMPRGIGLSYQDACERVQAEVIRQVDLGNNESDRVGHSNWLMQNWTQWLSEQGFHVELHGDEFELLSMNSVTT